MALKRTIVNGIINRIKLVGVELEGGWDKRPGGDGDDHAGIEHDGSVVFNQGHPLLAPIVPPVTAADVAAANGMITIGFDPRTGQAITTNPVQPRRQYPQHSGEIVLRKPLPPGSAELTEWVKRCYPTYVNATCGLHVHMSFFNRLNYQRLMTPAYTEQMVDGLKRWARAENLDPEHPLWPRINDPNHRHCAHLYLGDGQVKVNRKDYNSRGTDHSRYTAINYCDKQHGTVECRLLSMFADADQALRAIGAVVDTTNRFLSKFREREVRVRANVPFKSEVVLNFPGRV